MLTANFVFGGGERRYRKITIHTLEKFTEGLEEAPRHIFKFDTLNFDNKYFDKKS